MPYAVSHPVRYRHTTRIELPEGSDFENEFFEVDDKTFYFSKRVDFAEEVLVVEYIYESRRDHVPPEDIQAYANNIRKVQNLASYQMHMPNPEIEFGTYRFEAGDVNGPMVILTLMALGGAALLGYKYVYRYDPPYWPPSPVNARLEGIGGWLLLPARGILVNPITLLVTSRELLYVFSSLQWSIVRGHYGLGMPIVVAFELIFNTLIWSAYFTRSERVKATFTRQLADRPTSPPEIAGAEGRLPLQDVG